MIDQKIDQKIHDGGKNLQQISTMSRSSNFTLGFIAGAMIGAGVALLYAPDIGSNTRDRLSYRLAKVGDDLKSLILDLKREKEKLANDAKQKGDEVVMSAKQRAEDLIREAESLLESIEKNK